MPAFMPFEAGTRFGPYEIVSPIGAGGMGEIYRARDTRLDRTVAIKVLTGALAADSEARQRFEHEARAIAALNDPHICTIHDVGRQGDLDYLVLEHLQGETLADRLRRVTAVPAADALAIAIQIGDALDRAHRAGIVHRDLKPGNVMLVPHDGPTSAPNVKLLDFGLASRTSVPRAPLADASLSETVAASQVATRVASTPVVSSFSGTVPYMAPEQIAGDPGDQRTDIFAFGCVLYEMLAGRKAFDGPNALTVIAAITSSEPPPIDALASAHPLLDHVLRRCLAKDRERRWQTIRDATADLRWIADHPIAPPSTRTAAAVPPRSSASYWAGRAAFAAALLAALVAGAFGMRALGGRTPPPNARALRFEIATAPTDDPTLALSPDGTQLAFIAAKDRVPMLWVRSLDALESRALPGTAGAGFPFWAPDGRTVGFFADDMLKRIEVAGGTPLVIVPAPNGRGGTWNANGDILFVPGVSSPILRVSSRGGAVQAVTALDASTGPSHRTPQFLPDGTRFLFSSTLGTPETNGVYVGSLDGSKPVRILADDAGGRFAAPDRLLTIRQGALQAYRFDLASGSVQGEPTVIAQGFTGPGANAAVDTSRVGVLAYRTATVQRRQLVWVDRHGTVLRAIGEPASDFVASPELSADERSVAVFRQPTGDNDIWVIDLTRDLARRITDGPPADAHPLWDPDGQHIVFTSRRFGVGTPTRQALAGGGAAEPFLGKGELGQALAWTADRRYVLVRRVNAKGNPDLVAVATTGKPEDKPEEVPVAQSPADETEGQFSPDGRWVAFVSNETGRPEVFVQSFPAAGGRTQVSTSGGTQVRWSADGKELFYIAPDGKMMAAPIALAGASPDVKAAVTLFQTHLATGINVLGNKPQYAVARDGRFLLDTAIDSASAPIVVSVNWMRGLTGPLAR